MSEPAIVDACNTVAVTFGSSVASALDVALADLRCQLEVTSSPSDSSHWLLAFLFLMPSSGAACAERPHVLSRGVRMGM